MVIGLHVKYSLFLSDFNKNWIFSTDFGKIFKYKFYKNPFRGIGVLPYGQTDGRGDKRTDEWTGKMTKLIIAFRNLGNAPKKSPINENILNTSLFGHNQLL
jgi:hypothetical protein